MNDLLERILRQVNSPELLEILAESLNPTDLQSLLLEVYRRRAAHLTPADLLAQYEHNRFVRPSPVDPLAIMELDRLAFMFASYNAGAGNILKAQKLCTVDPNLWASIAAVAKFVPGWKSSETLGYVTKIISLMSKYMRA